MKYKIVLTDEAMLSPLVKAGLPFSSYVSDDLDEQVAEHVSTALSECGISVSVLPVY